MKNRKWYWKFIFVVILLIEAIILLTDINYVRKGELYRKTIQGQNAIENEVTLGERFALPRGTYVFRVRYNNAGEDSVLVIRNHDVEEGGRAETILELWVDGNFVEKEEQQQFNFATSDFEIIVRPGDAVLDIESVEIEQTSREKKLDFIRMVFWMFIFDCLILLPMISKKAIPVPAQNQIMWIEIMRIIGAAAVVLNHTASAGIRNNAILYKNSYVWFSIYHTIPVFAVPCFFMISGAIFLNPKKEITIEKLLKKYVPRVIVMYVVWSAVYAVYEMFFDDNYITMGSFWSKLIRGKDTLWFLGAVAGLYLLTPVLRKVVEEKKLLEYVIVLCIIFTFLPTMLKVYPPMSSVITIYDKFYMPVCYAGYFLIGYYLYQYPIEGKRKYLVYLCGMVSMLYSIVGGIIHSRYLGQSNGSVYNYYSLNVVILSGAIFLLVKNVMTQKKLSEKWRKRIVWISGKTAGIYVVHMLFNSLVYSWLLHCGYQKVWITIPCTAVVVFFLSLLVATAMRRIPVFSKWLM